MDKTRKPKVNLEERVNILSKVNILSEANQSLLRDIAASISEVSLKEKEVLFEKGEKSSEMYIIVEGAVRVHDGDYDFAVLRAGQAFGEYSLLEQSASARSASVTAVVPTRLLMLSPEIFYEFLSNRIEIVRGILKVHIKRSRRQNYFEEQMNEQKKELEKQRDLINQEKEKAEQLLLNILPSKIADELKTQGKVEAQQYEMGSVLFADIVGFDESSQELRATQLMRVLDAFICVFDEISLAHQAEKIKTMGGYYMCAAGIPATNQSNPIDLTLVALKMQKFMKDHRHEVAVNIEAELPFWELRIGIHTGPLTAGVIGKQKFSYDVWGETVKIAAQMERHSKIKHINISQDTHERIKDFFDCTPRDTVEIKDKGAFQMYFVEGIRKELSENEEGLEPNEDFRKKMQEKGLWG